MVGSTLQWGRERQLSRVILTLTLYNFVAKSPKRLLGTGWAGQPTPGEDFDQWGMTQARLTTAPSRKAKKQNHKLCTGEICQNSRRSTIHDLTTCAWLRRLFMALTSWKAFQFFSKTELPVPADEDGRYPFDVRISTACPMALRCLTSCYRTT